MKTTKINLANLRNEEHFQLQTEFKDLITQFDPKTLNIETDYTAYLPLYKQEEEALLVVRQSANTEKLIEADIERDDIFRGLSDAVKSSLNHFNPDKCAAGMRLQILLDRYGNVARKPYNEETAAIYKLVVEIQGEYATEAETIALTDWVTELNIKNLAFDALMKSRFAEDATKTELRMKQVRTDVDTAFRSIANRLDALMLVNGAKGYEAFVREFNSRVEKYNNTLAQRKGRNAKDDKETGTETKQ
jgi:hypothetical protein